MFFKQCPEYILFINSFTDMQHFKHTPYFLVVGMREKAFIQSCYLQYHKHKCAVPKFVLFLTQPFLHTKLMVKSLAGFERHLIFWLVTIAFLWPTEYVEVADHYKQRILSNNYYCHLLVRKCISSCADTEQTCYLAFGLLGQLWTQTEPTCSQCEPTPQSDFVGATSLLSISYMFILIVRSGC